MEVAHPHKELAQLVMVSVRVVCWHILEVRAHERVQNFLILGQRQREVGVRMLRLYFCQRLCTVKSLSTVGLLLRCMSASRVLCRSERVK